MKSSRSILLITMAVFFLFCSQGLASINISGIRISPAVAPRAGIPLTVTVSASSSDNAPVYYKFYYCANYGTSTYDATPWTAVQEYSTANTCQYTFSRAGKYIIVARAVTDPNDEPAALSMIGQVISIGGDNDVIMTGLSHDSSGSPNAGDIVRFTVNAAGPSDDPLYYRFYYCANYGTSAYNTTPWTVVQEYSTANTCDYSFPSPGNYIVVARVVTDPNNEPQDVSIIGQAITCNAQAADWEQRPNLNLARDQFAAGVIDNNLYVFGGNGNPNGQNLASLEIGDTTTGTWSFGTSNTIGVEELSGAVVNGSFYVFGAWGGGTPYGVFNFVQKYDPNTGQWTSAASKPTPVAGAPTAVYNNEIFVFGGYYSNESSDESLKYTVVEAYNPSTNTWRTVTHMPSAYSAFAVSVYQDRAYLIGGVFSQGEQYIRQLDVISYDFLSDTWTTTGLGALSSFRGFSYSNSAPVVNGKIYLAGGMELIHPVDIISEENTQPSSEMLIYDIASGSFTHGPSLPEPRDSNAVLIHNGYIYVIGGAGTYDDSSISAGVFRIWVE